MAKDSLAVGEGLSFLEAVATFFPDRILKTIEPGSLEGAEKKLRKKRHLLKDGAAVDGLLNDISKLAANGEVEWRARRTPTAPLEKMPEAALKFYQFGDGDCETLQGPGGAEDILYGVEFVDRRPQRPEDMAAKIMVAELNYVGGLADDLMDKNPRVRFTPFRKGFNVDNLYECIEMALLEAGKKSKRETIRDQVAKRRALRDDSWAQKRISTRRPSNSI